MSPPSRRLQTKPVITCLKTFLISYSLIFWVSCDHVDVEERGLGEFTGQQANNNNGLQRCEQAQIKTRTFVVIKVMK